ncbi:lytic polysaccharide monooxygenase [Ideonella sp. DXS29W]|uniref:Lytic polysaccharide monooxygenase n=1 Tax=Ideonella lacteola TaxID=2984193 RepID=A0ABU9BWF3_9BURK
MKHLPFVALVLTLGLAHQAAHAHGYVSKPESRGYQCKLGNNADCGAIQSQPEALYAPSGWPALGPSDGHIASADHTEFSPLDEQTKSRWFKRKMKAGVNKFTWTLTANHVTKNWRYYITKQDWNASKPLTRASFEDKPFCSIDDGSNPPPLEVTHTCTVPSRTGYQVILAVWERRDDSSSFYNVLDVKFPKKSVMSED